ncbi:glycosyl transferase family 2 [bacterium F11]|nr:glycosyl transferase family 2 [bacterium F11]
MSPDLKIVIVMPAFNAEKTLRKTLNDIPRDAYHEIILVDDASSDKTFSLAQELGLSCYRHDKNMGYGANQKTCYKNALEKGADIVVMLHPDNQYDARLVPYMTGLIRDGVCDVMMGARIRTRAEALKGGMPAYKYFMNRFLTLVEGTVFGIVVSEMHTGYRAYSRQVLDTIDFEKNSNDFVFDQQLIAQAVYHKFRIGEIPVPTRYFKEASSINFHRSLIYGIATMWTLFRFILHKMRICKYKILKSKIQ